MSTPLRRSASRSPSPAESQAPSRLGVVFPPSGTLARALLRVSIGLGLIVGLLPATLPGRPGPTDKAAATRLKLSEEQIHQLRTKRGTSTAALMRLPERRLPGLVRRLNYPDLPRQRAAFNMMQLRNADGVVPADARFKAITELKALRLGPNRKVAGIPAGASVNPKMLQPLTAGVDRAGWVALGPGNIGGRTRSILIHPQMPDVMFAASVAGGIWRTDDGGNEFYPVNDFMANLVISCMVMDPTNAEVIYAGTGEGFGNLDALRGAGIFQTTDGGKTWKQLEKTNTQDYRWVNRLALSSDGKVLLAATRSDSNGELGGIFRSQDPARTTWTQCLTEAIASVAFDPTNPSRSVAGGLRNGKVYYSEDGGATWNEATHDGDWSGRVEVTYARKDPKIVYVSVDNAEGELWRSEDGGKTYTLRNTGTHYLGEQGWYDNVVWAGDPTNSDFVIVGGIDLWKSINGGINLVDISTWWADNHSSAHADHHVIVAHPKFDGTSNKKVYFGNDGGIYMTDDVYQVGSEPDPPHTKGWVGLNHTYSVTQFYSAAGNVNSGVIIGGAQDNGTLRFTPEGGPDKWSEMFGGDGGFCAADPLNENYFYGEYVYLNIHRSTDAGKSAEYISGQYWNGTDWAWKPAPYYIPDAKNQTANFIAPFVLDPNNPERILAGGHALWRTDDARTANTTLKGPKWVSIKNSIGVPISAIALVRGKPDVIWVGYNNGDIFVTANGTSPSPTWVKIDHSGPHPLPNRYCTHITVDPSDVNRVYVTFGGYSKDNIWRTTDGGKNWTSIAPTLPESPAWVVAVHPKRSDHLYAGTGVGVFASENGGMTWSPTNEGPTNCSVADLFWMQTPTKITLVAATHGRSLFRIDIP